MGYRRIGGHRGDLTVVAPLLLGLFWGAPLVAREIEERTHDLAWTQSVTRRRWMASNVGCALAAAGLWGGAMSALVTWWRRPEDALHGRFGAVFDITGAAPVAYAVFAVALGILVGTALRRVLPALAATLATFAAVRVAIALWVRPRYLGPVHRLFSLVDGRSGAPAGRRRDRSRLPLRPASRRVRSVSHAVGPTARVGCSGTRLR